ncbi:MAG: putative zinc-binding metallopeptidase [Nitriliruptoraceae bacterium]|nr:putative zinc-binding metallopeptidase [Nitriliruptoraceae bacterium]
MDTFSCPNCGQLVFFANTACLRCATTLGFDADRLTLVAVDDPTRRCANHVIAACNWLLDDRPTHTDGHGAPLCRSCALTRTRPADGDADALELFAIAEQAKRRLVFQLLSLGIFLQPRDASTGVGVAFDLLASTTQSVITGHAAGVITLDLAESDAVHREKVRTKLSEPYRTVLGHFRHEIGHYLFTVLVDDAMLGEAQARFGDETADYQAALDRHYRDGAPAGWADEHVSEYATMHPAEDFAETVAHYLHIRGVLQSAAAFRLRVDGPEPVAGDTDVLAADPVGVALDDTDDIEPLIATWLPLSYALNAVNRSMGEADLYPFVLPPPVIDKLGFVHRIVRRATARLGAVPAP